MKGKLHRVGNSLMLVVPFSDVKRLNLRPKDEVKFNIEHVEPLENLRREAKKVMRKKRIKVLKLFRGKNKKR